jgi:hypothetical protein
VELYVFMWCVIKYRDNFIFTVPDLKFMDVLGFEPVKFLELIFNYGRSQPLVHKV